MTGDGKGGTRLEVLDHVSNGAPSELAMAVPCGARYTVLETGDIYAREDGRPFDRSPS